ncbi:hypothetical protein [Chryseobacterium sp. SL1]|uniref:hypothetical protein n=1 Tax=Chryseobacterium sp. SL1 TaxID=2995159 RepID=UPI0022738D56|nr:hypothetical protein [Chryseobacterium sp. SL1]MCY1662677.1 hypothetical protein [Chryseobacterium sp. SL1]
MEKHKLIIIMILIGLGINAQIYKSAKGEIVFRETSIITNKKLFDESLKTAKENFKESLIKSLLKEEENTGKEKEIEEMCNLSADALEMIYTEDSTEMYVYKFEDNLQDFSKNIILKVSEDKKSKKIIKGYDCYKVIYQYKENNEHADEEYKIYAKNTIYRREMWVTEKIKSLYHPIVFDKIILEKYYPLEILETQSDIKGFERRFKLEKIELK